MSLLSLEGYHGTSSSIAKVIDNNGFIKSEGDDQWLGDGVYFFTNGLSDSPEKQAEAWALVESYKRKYQYYSVLKAHVEVDSDNCLDLSDEATSDYIDRIALLICRKLNIDNISEGVIVNYIRKHNLLEQDIDVTIGDVYIKLTEDARKYKVRRFTPNCTIMAVNNLDCIVDYKCIKSGRV